MCIEISDDLNRYDGHVYTQLDRERMVFSRFGDDDMLRNANQPTIEPHIVADPRRCVYVFANVRIPQNRRVGCIPIYCIFVYRICLHLTVSFCCYYDYALYTHRLLK